MKRKEPHTFPVIDTERIRLRKPSVRDISRILRLANNPNIEEMTLSFPYPYHEEHAVSWLKTANTGFENQDHYIFAIALLPEDTFVGESDCKFKRSSTGPKSDFGWESLIGIMDT